MTARQAAARKRAEREKQERLQQAIEQLPELKQRQEEAAKRAGQGECGKKIRKKEPRVSTTDAEARRMKMPNGGFNPAVNVQLATDTASRAIVGVEVSKEGADSAGLSAPMRQQVEERTGGKVEEHLLDGGYLRTEDIEEAHDQGVALFVPPKPAKNPARRGRELDPKPGDSEAVLAWKQRMRSEEGKQIYKQRAATSETVNADLRTCGDWAASWCEGWPKPAASRSGLPWLTTLCTSRRRCSPSEREGPRAWERQEAKGTRKPLSPPSPRPSSAPPGHESGAAPKR